MSLQQQHQEAQFLASQQARTNSRLLRRRETDAKRRDAVHAFWTQLRGSTSEWKAQLEQLLMKKKKNQHHLLSESDKRDIHMQLCKLKQDLLQLRKRCLSGGGIDGEDNNSNDNVILIIQLEDLSISDVRLLHEEFQKCQEMLDQAWAELLPKKKFVFLRYQKAILEQQQQQQQQQQQSVTAAHTDSATNGGGGSTTTLRKEILPKPQNCLHDIAHAHVVVDKRGNFTVTAAAANSSSSLFVAPPQSNLLLSSENGNGDDEDNNDAPPIILQNIQDSVIELQGSRYKSIHMLDLMRCSVRFAKNAEADNNNVVDSVGVVVQSAVHVTNCHHVHFELLRGTCQQLRLHDSSNFKCSLTQNGRSQAGGVLAGAILEDCRRILFEIHVAAAAAAAAAADAEKATIGYEADDDKETPLLDVKDFNFLKKGVRSPNYTIEWVQEQKRKSDGGTTTKANGTTSQVQQESTPAGKNKQQQQPPVVVAQVSAAQDDEI